MTGLPDGGLSPHPYAALFPLIDGAAFDDLVADIGEQGLRERIVLLDGQVLDGRNRYRAAVAAGLFEANPPRRALKLWFRDYDREIEGDPLAYVLSHNLHRRHLSTSQRAMIGAEIAGLKRGRPAGNGDNPSIDGLSVAQAAERLRVGESSIERARIVRDHGVPELAEAVRQGDVPVSVAEQVARLSPEEQRSLIDAVDRKLLRQAFKDLRAEQQAEKKTRRAEREAELAPRIAAGERDLKALIESGQRFGVILADPEWKFAAWSDETGMDRAPDNHYPTSSLDVIASRPVGEIAAENCLLLLWATAPMLPEAIEVMAGWGFTYKTNASGHKDRMITGYWLRSQHEHLLIGTRGDVPCPAMGDQWSSVFEFPVTEHSAKPDWAHRFADRFFPNWAKIELNARTAYPGWFAWGAEAPEHEADAPADALSVSEGV
nr:MT-A70 family methyltransferase [Methylobacterium sp. ZNC0032]